MSRLPALCARIAAIQVSFSAPGAVFTPAQIATFVNIDARDSTLPTALQILGWHRRKVWSRKNGRRVLRVYYAPPGHKVPAPKRGRPAVNLANLLNIV